MGFAKNSMTRTRPHKRLSVESSEDRLAPAVFTVTTINNAGAGSLREAISRANATAGADAIHFDIVGGGVQSSALASALPGVTDQVVIDGTTQPWFPATFPVSSVHPGDVITATATDELGNTSEFSLANPVT